MQVYGLKRLVRGLASGRQGARQGCALALTHLLPAVPRLPITQVLAVMASELEVSGQAKVRLHLHCTITLQTVPMQALTVQLLPLQVCIDGIDAVSTDALLCSAKQSSGGQSLKPYLKERHELRHTLRL